MSVGFGPFGGLELDMAEGDRERGKDDREALCGAPMLPLPCELEGALVLLVLRIVLGPFRAFLVALVL